MPKTPLNFLATLKAKPGCEDKMFAAIEACVGPTRAEPANVNYDLHRDREDAATFVLYEGWQSQAALDEHMRTPHFRALGAALANLVQPAPDGKPFIGQPLIMLTEPAPLKA